MKRNFLPCTLLALAIAVPASGQRGPGHGSIDIGSMGPSKSPRFNPDVNSGASLFLSGKVVLEDGTEPGEAATIETICQGRKHPETHSDKHGNFSFRFADKLNISTSDAGDAESGINSDSSLLLSSTGRSKNRDAQDCELQASLQGFVSEAIKLNGIPSNTQTFNVGRVVLHRVAETPAPVISVTDAVAPDPARKAFEKGLDQERQSNWDEAQRSLETAVQLYEKYASAWFELGRVQLQKNDTNAALHSFDAAVAADPKFASPYQLLMQLAVKQGRWPAVVELTDKLLVLNPVSFPDAWFFNSAGNYLLKNFDAAENSARQGIKVDAEHHFPRFEYLLGMILVERRQYSEAATHFRQFLQVAKTSLETEEGRKQLAEAERLSATASVPAP